MAKFAKGVSGNPGGRPKAQGDLREIARRHTAEAVQVLVQIMGDDTAAPSARVSAASALLDRAWGRPSQEILATISPNVTEFDAAFSVSIAELLDKMRVIDAPSPKASENLMLMAEGGNA